MDYDLKISGGRIVDGSGAPAYMGDVGIRQGTIAALGKATGTAAETINADGRVIAPGFVDIHTHYDAQILWDQMLTISPWHGVTTVVMGNCGFGVAPTRPGDRDLILRTLEKVEGMSLAALREGLGEDWGFETFPEYLDAIERRGAVINVAAMIGHTPVRLYVMGEEATERPATPAEVARMRDVVREGLQAGALGFATSKSPTHVGYGGRPVPSRVAETSEIAAIVGALGAAGRGILQVTIGPEFFLEEMAALARSTGCAISWTALLGGMLGPGSHRALLERSAELAREGLAIFPQVTCRPLNFEFTFEEPFIFESLALFKPISASDHDGKVRIYSDREFRAAFSGKTGPGTGKRFADRWSRTVVSYYPPDPSLEERNLVEMAAERGVNPVDLALDLALSSNLEARFRMAVMNDDEREVEELLTDRNTVLGLSDAGAHASQLCDACFSTHLLGRWVREKGVLSLEEAVRMLTSRPAEVFGIADRGRLQVGRPADVVVFDPQTVGAGKLRRVRDLPAGAERLVSDAAGIEAVVVNGMIVRHAGRDAADPAGTLPGKLLRGGRASG